MTDFNLIRVSPSESRAATAVTDFKTGRIQAMALRFSLRLK
jgi:hypothetical protein